MNNSNSLWQLAIQKFKRNKTGLMSFWFIILCGFIAVFCYILAPDNSNSANQMHLEIHSKSPGFSVQILSIPPEKKNKTILVQYIPLRKEKYQYRNSYKII